MKKILEKIKKHKKPIIIIACAAFIGVAVYTDMLGLSDSAPVSEYLYNDTSTKILGEAALVDNYQSGVEESKVSEIRSSYFSSAELNREKSRDEALETLQVVVDSAEEHPEVKTKALSEIMQIASDIEIESTVEEMIKAKGYEDCVAIISGENINVIVKTDGLATTDVAKITDIVTAETGFTPSNIRIVEKA